MTERILYGLTRDHDLARALDERLPGAIAFFYNDAARLHQAVTLRPPEVVLVDTDAIRAEYGDAGLRPVIDFLRRRAPAATLLVRPGVDAVGHLVAAEAGEHAELMPSGLADCVEAVSARCR